ncbi:hypothetical protein UlMin_023461 [Ulmus minor]
MATGEINKPPYSQMIIDAIEALNEKKGSNKSTISKHIESTHGNLPAGHSTLLSHHLNKMKENGELVFWKNNYSKPDPNAPPRRGRGRPPKPRDLQQPASLPTPVRSRGRPPKDPNATPKPPKVKVSSGESGRPRGRPRKMARPTGGLAVSDTKTTAVTAASTGKPRGRPPKAKVPLAEVSVQ